MTRNTHSNRFVSWGSLVIVILAGNFVQAVELATGTPQVIEIFTTTDSSVGGEAAISQQPDYMESELHVYELDGIQRMEAKLSEGLTADPEQSKRVVLQRFQQLHEHDRARMQRAAMGLAKAMQYGIDRYPAIVFDGDVAIYGVTDIDEALHRYQQWREDRKR